MGEGSAELALDYAERALALGDRLGLDRSAMTVLARGSARLGLRDGAGAIDDYREAIALATEAGQGRWPQPRTTSSAARSPSRSDGRRASRPIARRSPSPRRAGSTPNCSANVAAVLAALGEFDEALGMFADIAARAEQTNHLRRLVASRRRTIAILVLLAMPT